MGSFPDSPTGTQLYRQSFSIDSISDVKGVILSIRYKYGCVVYLNGAEAWRNGVDGDVAVDSVSTNENDELRYRTVSLSGRSVPTSESPTPVDYLKQGTNVIAIALVSPSTALKSTFDAMVRLMPTESESHVWDFSLSSLEVKNAASAFDGYNNYHAYSSNCSAELSLTLEKDRCEWISSIEVQNTFSYFDQMLTRIVFGDGSFKREGMAAVIQWMVENREKGYFKNLEYLQISGHKAAAYEGTAEDALALQNQIVANLHTMCTDKVNFPKLNTLNFNGNAYNEFNNGFDAALRTACNRTETGVSTRAFQVAVNYPPMCSTSSADNYWYYDMMNDDEMAQFRFTWNWEMSDTINVYAPAGPFSNNKTDC